MHNALFLSLSVTSRESLELTQASYNYLSPRVVVTSVCLPLLPVPSRDRRIHTLCKSHPSQGVTARRDGMRKSVRTRHAREYCVSTRDETSPRRARSRGRRIDVEVNATDRERSHYNTVFAQRHPLRKLQTRKRGRTRKRKRGGSGESATLKTNQTGRDGIRRPPGATTIDGFTPVGEAEVQIAPPSGLHPTSGKPPR